MENALSRLAQRGYRAELVDALEPVLGEGRAAVAQVVVAQYGGILATSASVLVVIDQWVVDQDGRVRAGGTTFDVRLTADEPEWTVTMVRPARPMKPSRDLTRPARQLLENDHVALPYAAESDVRSGRIDDVVLSALTSLSRAHRLDVSVLRSGHPVRVFGTERRSSHTDGLAVDLWAIDGRPIVDGGDRAVAEFMRAASEVGAYQVGGPRNLDGEGTAFFSDDTHQDHLHLGFTP